MRLKSLKYLRTFSLSPKIRRSYNKECILPDIGLYLQLSWLGAEIEIGAGYQEYPQELGEPGNQYNE